MNCPRCQSGDIVIRLRLGGTARYLVCFDCDNVVRWEDLAPQSSTS